ncbi:MAG TPA: tripartite tricarboxylate transporter substrate binding protein [Usitatibacteraceae bacterium]
MKFSRAIAILLALALSAMAVPAAAQYPGKPVTIVVPFPPGGGTDTGTRIIAQRLSLRWGQPVLVENRAGAAGQLGADYVSKAAPDGYTLLMGNIGTQSINPAIYKKLPYNPDTAFQPVTLVAELPLVMLVNAASPATSPKAIIDLAKVSPGQLTYSSSGSGGSMHLAAAMFENEGHVQFLHVPYKGGGPAIADLLGGHVDMTFATVLEAIGHVKSGKLRALGITGATRSPALPEVPTIAESTLPGFNSISWIGLLAPAGTPMAIAERIANDVHEVLAIPDVRQQLITQGAIPVGNQPRQFAALIDDDRRRYTRIIQEKGIKAE